MGYPGRGTRIYPQKSGRNELEEAVRAVMAGRRFYSEEVTETLARAQTGD